MYVH
jgi:hypothetical protein